MKKNNNSRRAEIRLNSISPLELWEGLGLAQPREEKGLSSDVFSADFLDDESREAFKAFREDCPFDGDFEQEIGYYGSNSDIIPSDKGGLFVWSLLNEYSKRREQKLSSLNNVFKDELSESINEIAEKFGVSFEDDDFDQVCRFLAKKELIRTSRDSVRITRRLSALFHEKYKAWLVFWEKLNRKRLSFRFF